LESIDGINLVQDRDRYRAVVHVILNLWVP
jgi:hypothetical protein